MCIGNVNLYILSQETPGIVNSDCRVSYRKPFHIEKGYLQEFHRIH